MRLSVFLFFCIALFMYGCHAADQKKQAPLLTASGDTTVPHKELLTGKPQQPDSEYCLIKKLYQENEVWYIDADYVQFLTGDKAVTAAVKKGEADTMTGDDGKISVTVPNDYFIVNDNPAIRKLALAKDVVLQLVVYKDGNPVVENAALKELNKSPKAAIFILQFDDKLVKNIQQQYLP
jgi:hypothetical protein